RSPWVSTPAPSKPERVEIRQPLRAVGHSPARRAAPLEVVDQRPAEATRDGSGTPAQARSFLTLWEFALALNRKDADALAVAADGTTCDFPIEGSQIRKLLGTVWFRAVFRSLSTLWRDRLLDVLVDDTRIHNHVIGEGRRAVRLSQMSYEDLQKISTDPGLPEAVRADVQLLVAIGTVWGGDALARARFDNKVEATRPSVLDLLPPFRQS